MLNTKYVLMFVVLSAGLFTALTATGMSQTQTAFASTYKERSHYFHKERVCEDNNNNNCNDVKQKLYQENNCKIENSNENKRHSDYNDNHIYTGDQELNCWNYAQNAGQDATAQDDAFSGPSD
jgi:maltose-binding protein MalE